MALDADDEILQDFLVEASEILEQLNEQLVTLEQTPDDKNLLNAIFRGFHTIKGGAGFLSLTALVEVCHRAEDIFNLLRNGEKRLNTPLMDAFLEVLDVLNHQFESLRAHEEPAHADPALLQRLESMNHPGDDEEPAQPAAPPVAPPPAPAPVVVAPPSVVTTPAPAPVVGGDITDEEFEALLDALDNTPGNGASSPSPAVEQPATPAAASDEITEDEFEALLDQLHGKGQFGGAPQAADEALASSSVTSASATAETSEDISEAEFEALLDQLHGKGKFGGAPQAASDVPAVSSAASSSAAEAAEAAAGENITESEFEALLDQLHGKGKFGGVPSQQAGAAAAPAPAAAAPAAPEPAAAKAESPARVAEAKADAAPQAETTVRVDTKRLDDIMNLVGELVLVRNRLSTLAGVESGSGDAREEMAKAIANLAVVTGDLQTSVMKTRMQPIKKVFGRFPRVVRDLARSLKKEVNLELFGEETDLDKNLVEALADPLVHLVRNAVDHGIEMPDVRQAAGKTRAGTVHLSAQQEGDHILLSIEDDGAGMDPETLRRSAVRKGMMDEEAAARLDDRECFMLIFAPGFSTKTEISDISGRGVGMDVVKTRIAQLNGTIDIDSQKGRGTKLTIKVPLTLAIMPTLMVKLGRQTFAFPLVNVSEIFHLDLTKTNVVDGQRVVVIRERAIPIYYLSSWLLREMAGVALPRHGHVVMVHVGTQQIGFVVDQLIGQEEVVIKPLGALIQGTPGLAGATITGDGKIALILDLPSLMKTYAGHR